MMQQVAILSDLSLWSVHGFKLFGMPQAANAAEAGCLTLVDSTLSIAVLAPATSPTALRRQEFPCGKVWFDAGGECVGSAVGGISDQLGVGGILSGADAAEKIKADALLAHIYSGLIYRGPALIAECCAAIRSVGKPL